MHGLHQSIFISRIYNSALKHKNLSSISSPSAQRVIQRAGFVDLTPEVIPLSSQGQRLALSVQTGNTDQLIELQNLLKTIEGASRLTTTLILKDDQRSLIRDQIVN